MDSTELEVRTAELITDITDDLAAFSRDRGDGLLNVFVRHATAGLAVIETGSGTEPDLDDALRRLLPVDDRYVHRHGPTGHGRDHVVPAFLSPSLTIPVLNGRMALGTWQSVVIADTNASNPVRRVRISFLTG